MDWKEVRATARERMKGFCRVCPSCDGRACSGEVPGMGGLGTGSAFRNNITALDRVRLNMRLVHDVKHPVTEATVLGLPLQMPVLAAPVGGVSYNMGDKLTEEQYIEAIVSGCKEAGIVACTGDGVPPLIHESGFAAISKEQGWGIPFIKPWDSEELDEKLLKASKTGCSAIGMDIDAAGLITLAKMGRPVAPKSPSELAAIVRRVHDMGMKFILKGVMTKDDALIANRVGCDAIVVSNHGGRVLDHTPGTAEVLPGIAALVRGRMEILVDGGVRNGVDILKMLALGADAVMLGRPFIIAAMGGEGEGVRSFAAMLHDQLVQAMLLTGCESVKEAGLRLVSLEPACGGFAC